ncbi:MAG: 3-isopropylmalate dehydratase small subunit [Nitrososphaeraceae archaeon]
MKPFNKFTSKFIPFPFVNIDTDQIIPKQFLKLTQKTGFGKYLFYDWRYEKDGQPKKDFVLNKSKYLNRHILLTLDNFGSGSSREHAVWALSDYGFKAIISTSFADIFYSNCIKNGLLPITLLKDQINYFFKNEELSVEIDLENQEIKFMEYGINKKFKFQIDRSKKMMLMVGLDEIGMTLQLDSEITKYEKNKINFLP